MWFQEKRKCGTRHGAQICSEPLRLTYIDTGRGPPSDGEAITLMEPTLCCEIKGFDLLNVKMLEGSGYSPGSEEQV